MKNRNRILTLIVAIASVFTGCSNFLTVDIPDTLLKKNYWKSEDHAKAALSGVYQKLGDNLPTLIKWGGMRADIYGPVNSYGTAERQMADQDIRTTNGLTNWSGVYQGINWANSFIANAHLVLEKDASFTQEKLDVMMGQAYGIRALYYFYLVRTFKSVPLVDMPYESDTQAPYIGVSSEDDVLDFIERDLEKALKLSAETFTRPEDRYGRITKNGVRALWADVKLWRGEYKGVVSMCDSIARDYKGTLENQDSWFSQFSAGNAQESIFEYQYVEDGPSSSVGSLFNGTLGVNYKAYKNNVLKAYPKTGTFETGDTVRYQRMFTTVVSGSSVSYKAFKYVGLSYDRTSGRVLRDATGLGKVNFIFYRYQEVLLMRAEALSYLNRYDEAVDAINEIRKSLDLDVVTSGEYGSGDIFLDKLIAERVAELGYEGKDWFTLVRVARQSGNSRLLIDRVAENSCLGTKEQILKARVQDEESWFLPYYDSEVENNKLLEQKEFYKGKR